MCLSSSSTSATYLWVTFSSSFSARVTSSSPASPSLASLSRLVLGVPADVADRDPGVLRLVLRDLDELLAALLGELREDDPDDRAVVGRVDAEVGVADGLLDRGHRALVERASA